MTVEYTAAAAWAAGPDLVYGRLADAAVASIPGPLDGRLAVDAGAGTGAASRALVRRRARVVAVDLSAAMLAVGHRPAVVADVRRMPFASGGTDLTMAAFVLSHLADPGVALAELARITRAGGTVVVTAFHADKRHPVKDAVDRVLAAHGYRPPGWYVEFKRTGEVQVGTPAALLGLADAVGLTRSAVDEIAVGLTGLAVPALVGWRLGMAHVAPFLAGLHPATQRDLTADACAAVTAALPADPLPILVLRGSVT
jgi:SAM-dependent methyltransferase